MGQSILEGCQLNCRGQQVIEANRLKKQLYLNGMLAQIPDFCQKQNNTMYKSVTSITMNNKFLLELKDMPNQYLQFINYLFVSRIKFQDNLFAINQGKLNEQVIQHHSIRIPDIDLQLAEVYSSQPFSKSKIIQLLQLLQKHLPEMLQNIKPVYIDKVGLALCRFYLNGALEQILIDDRVPVHNIKYLPGQRYWYLLIQKAMAKVIGSYSSLQMFTLAELYQEITGLSIQPIQQQDSNSSMDSRYISFKEGIRSDTQCYLAGNHKQIYRIYLIKNNVVRSIRVNHNVQVAFFRLKIDQKQKISIRLSFLNWKYQYPEQPQWQNPYILTLYQQYTMNIVVQSNRQISNSLYLGQKTFIELKKGSYVLMIKRGKKDDRRANLVLYASTNVNFTEILSKQNIKIMFKNINNQTPNSNF